MIGPKLGKSGPFFVVLHAGIATAKQSAIGRAQETPHFIVTPPYSCRVHKSTDDCTGFGWVPDTELPTCEDQDFRVTL
jgi:hypothetical protein